MLQPGEKVDGFSALDQDGSLQSLSQLMGKKGLIVYFYPKDDTPGCTREAQSFVKHADTLQQMGYLIVGISKDSPQSHTRFREKYAISFPLLSDHDATLCQQFGVWGEKKNFGRIYMGIRRSTFVLDVSGNVLLSYPKVKVADHVEQIIQDLKAF